MTNSASVRTFCAPVAIASSLLLWHVAISQPTAYPFRVSNCGLEQTIAAPPKRAATLNQGATEVMLALGLQSSLAATAYLDDAIDSRWAKAYRTVSTTFRVYPDAEQLRAVSPDFLYASYRSAFTATSINYTEWPEIDNCTLVYKQGSSSRLSCRRDLNAAGVGTYLQEHACEAPELRVGANSMIDLEAEIRTIASIFNVTATGNDLIRNITRDFASVRTLMSRAKITRPLRALWLDSWHDTEPLVGACCGSPNFILQEAGMEIAAEQGLATKSVWTNMNWTDIVARQPDIIVVIDAEWSTAASKLRRLCNSSHPASQLKAVRTHKFISVPFSASTLGVHVGDAAVNLALAALYEAGHMSAAEVEQYFGTTDESSPGFRLAYSDSGIGFLLSLPPDLGDVCMLDRSGWGAGSASSSQSLSQGTIAGIVVASLVGAALVAVALTLALRYRRLRVDYETLLAGPAPLPSKSVV